VSETTQVNIVLLGGIGGSIAAIVLAPAVMVFVASGICIANAPYAIYKERVLTKIPSLRYMNNKLRETANELAENVDELSSEIDILEPEAERAATVEAQLRDIADQQQVNVDKLVELVKENEIVLVQMRVSEHGQEALCTAYSFSLHPTKCLCNHILLNNPVRIT
jgi:ribosomal protein L18E